MANFWLVCYDVRDDKRRQLLAKLLEQRCQRVQYSVFECPLEEKILEDLLNKRWLKVLNLEKDSLRAYPLNPSTKAQVKVYGGPLPYEPPDFLIL
ncbi:MAG: CRISPR-associated endonuclease Cas2 [Limnospira sp. PMC 1291.21]|uniref:CRISPR-associated endoribonuclease Cas2 n=3 Tax=Limnospira TaxID=2596745 RepID=A0A9P1KG71_9CYAN|nr:MULTISPECIES: CRISPR-associated endonuclease Cas2 [Limnospira]EKD07486.1 CRISPR-associated protein Cas2 [Arthrospira platensis C1]MDC0838632.1 CRISPR-associated endonuclease Cas2 [Limnoraphis robusta]QJB25807.1 CRISPR-associated endonuclease Cas2 [Limnospira fusiformis SAG 85.79]EDZ91895.1 CRISPR-associated protein Cas2 [Limnospira maxima CS-328]MDT9176094.1 CRISPR-associated endonuclease Cas2 [Limnospira sp. PMC 1238.20]